MRVQVICGAGETTPEKDAEILFFCGGKPDAAVIGMIEKELSGGETAAAVPRVLSPGESYDVDPVRLEAFCAGAGGFAVKKSVYDAVGGVDRRLGSATMTDLCWRIRGRGMRVSYLPEARVDAGESAPPDYGEQLTASMLMRCKHGRMRDVFGGALLVLKAIRHPKLYGRGIIKRLLAALPKMPALLLQKGCGRVASFYGVGYALSRGRDPGSRPSGTPPVSVIVRTFRRPARLRTVLESLRHQTYKNFEVVVVEDDRADCKAWVERDFPDLAIVYRAAGENTGRANAANLGFAAAGGRYLNLLDDDDYFYPEYLELAVAAAERTGARMIFTCPVALETEIKTEEPYVFSVEGKRRMDFPRIDIFSMIRRCVTASNGVLFEKSLALEAGGMRPELRAHEDWSLWLRMMRCGSYAVQPYAACCFTVPADREAERRRLSAYSAYDDLLLEDPALRYTVTGKELSGGYDGLIHDLMYLKQRGELNAFLCREYERVTKKTR